MIREARDAAAVQKTVEEKIRQYQDALDNPDVPEWIKEDLRGRLSKLKNEMTKRLNGHAKGREEA